LKGNGKIFLAVKGQWQKLSTDTTGIEQTVNCYCFLERFNWCLTLK